MYEFSLNIIFILILILNINTEYILLIISAQIEIVNIINFIKINIKYHYNQKHQSLVIYINKYILL